MPIARLLNLGPNRYYARRSDGVSFVIHARPLFRTIDSEAVWIAHSRSGTITRATLAGILLAITLPD